MAQTKEQLVELIEAYAAAKVSSNAKLISLAAGALQQILLTVTFTNPPSDPVVADDFVVPSDNTQSTVRRSRKVAE